MTDGSNILGSIKDFNIRPYDSSSLVNYSQTTFGQASEAVNKGQINIKSLPSPNQLQGIVDSFTFIPKPSSATTLSQTPALALLRNNLVVQSTLVSAQNNSLFGQLQNPTGTSFHNNTVAMKEGTSKTKTSACNSAC
jgi:hypothetical protein